MQNQRPGRQGWGLAPATRQLLDTAEPGEAARRNPQVDRAIAAFLAQPADSPVELTDALADQLLILAHHFRVDESYFTDRAVADAVTARRRRGEWGEPAASEAGAREAAMRGGSAGGGAGALVGMSASGRAAGGAAAGGASTGGASVSADPGDARRPRRLAGVALVSVGVLAGAAVGGAAGYRVGAGSGRSEALAEVSAQQSAQASQRSAHEAAQRSAQGGPAAGQHPMGDPVQQIAAHVLPGVVALHVHSGNVTAGGSGIVLTPDGLLLTNDHVIAAAAHGGQLTVVLHDGTSRPAHIVGRDPATDIAVVAADGVNGLTPVAVGNSDSVRVGEHVVEVGAPLGQGATAGGGLLTATISGLSHPAVVGHDAVTKAPEVLSGFQTDAGVNPASSGGPLVDSHGLVIGVDTVVPAAVAAGPGGAAVPGVAAGSGVAARSGFAIPINLAERVAKHLIGVARGVDTTAGARTGVSGRPAPIIPPPGAKIVEPQPVAVSNPTQ